MKAVESFWSEWIREDRQERANSNSTVGGYLYTVNRKPTYDPISEGGNGHGEGR